MLFVNISSDYVHITDGREEDFLPRNGIENILGATLLQYTQRHPVEMLFLLNGPGGFTNLRVGTLAINTLNTLLDHDTGTFVPIASLTKIALFGFAYQQGRLPRYGIIYIGQKHNVRRYDFQNKTYDQIAFENISYSDDTFLDFAHDHYRDNDDQMVSFSMDNNTLFLNYRGQSHELPIQAMHLPLTMTVEPQYLIEPTLN